MGIKGKRAAMRVVASSPSYLKKAGVCLDCLLEVSQVIVQDSDREIGATFLPEAITAAAGLGQNLESSCR